jgi:hypothetical protein
MKYRKKQNTCIEESCTHLVVRLTDVLREIRPLLKISFLLQTALAAETHLVERLTYKITMHVKCRVVCDRSVGKRTLSEQKMYEEQILLLKALIRRRGSRSLHFNWNVNKFKVRQISS